MPEQLQSEKKKKGKGRKLRPVCPISVSFFRTGNVRSTGCFQSVAGHS